MTKNFKPSEFLNALHLPLQDLKAPAFCNSAKAVKIEAWVNNLQATKITHTSVILYQSIPDLNRVKTDYENRFNMMEAVRPTVQHCIEGIMRDYLQHPLSMSEEAHKFAVIAQALQKYMVDGYLLAARDICNLPRFKVDTLDLLGKILHRAISGIGLFFLRSYQLYASSPRSLWLNLHNLYQIAEFYEILDKSVSDMMIENVPTTTLADAWGRVILLASCRPNQLGKNDIAHCYRAFGRWSSLLKTHEGVTSDKDNFYIINLSQDEPPTYKSRFKGGETDRIIELDLKPLLSRISKQGGSKEDIDHDPHMSSVPKDFPDTLLDHLLNTWGNVTQRKLGRRDVNITAEISVGLVDCHYFLSGKRKFEELISGSSDYEQAGTAFTPQAFSKSFDEVEAERPTWQAQIQNVSAGGYCLLWKGAKPPKLEAGEIICLKEQNRYSWNLGVVRWVKQLKSASQTGVQLLSNHATAAGAAQIFDMGGQSDFMRAMLIPANNQTNQPATIVTAKAPFVEMQKAKLMSAERSVSIRLTKCLFSTGSIKQFTYTEMAGTEEKNTPSRSSNNRDAEGFNSSWDDI